MLGLIFSFLFLILFVGLLIIVAVLGFIRSVFTFGGRKNPMRDNHSEASQQPTTKRKIFDEKEGEYVDFEEVE